MSFGVANAQVEITADDSQFQTCAGHIKRTLANMGQQAGVSSTTIRRSLLAAGGQFRYFALEAASGRGGVESFGAGILALGSAFKVLIVPVSAGLVWLKLLIATAEAGRQRMRDLADETKRLADAQSKLREERGEQKAVSLGMPSDGISGEIGKRKKQIEDEIKLIATLRAAQEKEASSTPSLLARAWKRTLTLAGRTLGESTPNMMPGLYDKQIQQHQRGIEALGKEIQMLEAIERGRANELIMLGQRKKILEASLALEEGRGAALKERAPVRATAQFMGAEQLWKQVQGSVAGSGAREQLQAIKESVRLQAGMKKSLESIDRQTADLKQSGGPARYAE